MNIIRDIQSVSNFKKHTAKILTQIKQTKQPVILTVNGQADAVVIDAESYQELIETKELSETVSILRKRLDSMKDSQTRSQPFEEVFMELAEEFGVRLDQ